MSSKMRVHELAKELKKESKDVIDILSSLGMKGKKAVSSLSEEEVGKIRKSLKEGKAVKKAKKVSPKELAKKTVKTKKTVETGKPVKAKKLVEEKKVINKKVGVKVKKKAGVGTKAEEVTGPENKVKEKKIDNNLKIPKPQKEPIVFTEPAEEESEITLPDKFKKEIGKFKVEQVKVKPTMQRAFETIRKIEPRKFRDQKGTKRYGRNRHAVAKADKKPAVTAVTAPRKKSIKMQEGITVKEFAELLGQKLPEIIKKFMELGVMTTINEPIDMDAAV
ncbi:MAG: translation initiation factor IF-2 N-terminal domain-containing protein, partial [Thermodesulfovibrionales bacterium]